MEKKSLSNRLVVMGNLLEFFDLYLYIHLASVISQKFFPASFEGTAFFRGFTFCQLYLIAPIACAAFAYFGDKLGRKKIIISTAMVMAVASVCIVFLPTYETWGENATILLLMLRLIQGVALAGEPTAANLYLIESSSLLRDAVWYQQASWYVKIMGATESLGGLFALLLGYASLTLFKDYTHGWRIPFIFCSIFVIFLFWIRTRLSESEDYREATSNQNVNIFNEEGVSRFYRSILFQYQNAFYWILLLLAYPIVFYLCFLQISPKVVSQPSSPEDVLLYNAYVSLGTIVLSLLSAYFPLRYRWNLRTTTACYVNVGCLFALGAIVFLENHASVYLIYICQILMMSLINFGLVMPGLLKVFPVIGRYSLMGIGWGIARLINFILVVIVIAAIEQAFGLYGCLILLYGIVTLGLYAVYAHVSYDTLGEASMRKTLQRTKTVEGEEVILISDYKY